VLAFSRAPVFLPRRPQGPLADLLFALAGPALGACAADFEAVLQAADHFDVVELLWEVEEALRQRGY
jgi:hypothetical protein